MEVRSIIDYYYSLWWLDGNSMSWDHVSEYQLPGWEGESRVAAFVPNLFGFLGLCLSLCDTRGWIRWIFLGLIQQSSFYVFNLHSVGLYPAQVACTLGLQHKTEQHEQMHSSIFGSPLGEIDHFLAVDPEHPKANVYFCLALEPCQNAPILFKKVWEW